jgi:hypothetical protein
MMPAIKSNANHSPTVSAMELSLSTAGQKDGPVV